MTVYLNGEETDKSVELKILKRTDFDLSSIEDFINGKGTIGNFNSFCNKGFLSIEPNRMNDKNYIEEAAKLYLKNVLNLPIVKLIFNLNVNTIINMINIDYLDASNNVVTDNGPIASINITVKEGHNDEVDDFHIVGKANVKLAEQKKVLQLVTKFELGEINVENVSNQKQLKQAIQTKLLEENNNEELTTAFKNQDIELDNVQLNEEKTFGLTKLKFKFNSSIQNDNDITFNFSIAKNQVN